MIDFEIVGKILSRGSLILLIAFFIFSLFGTSKVFEKLINFCFTGAICLGFLGGISFLANVVIHNSQPEIKVRTQYRGAVNGEVKSFVKCHDEEEYHICTTKDDKDLVVEKYWKSEK